MPTFSFEEARAPARKASEAETIRASVSGPIGSTPEEHAQALASARADLDKATRPEDRQLIQEQIADMERHNGESGNTFSFEEATAPPKTFSFEDAHAATPLPVGVQPSSAGAGRGSLNPAPAIGNTPPEPDFVAAAGDLTPTYTTASPGDSVLERTTPEQQTSEPGIVQSRLPAIDTVGIKGAQVSPQLAADIQAVRTARAKAERPATAENIAAGTRDAMALSAMRTWQGMRAAYADATGDQQTVDEAKRFIGLANKWEQDGAPVFDSEGGEMLYHGITSAANSAPGIAAGVLSPALGAAVFGGQSAAEAYGKYRERGGTPSEAGSGATLEGAIMGTTRYLPMNFITKSLGQTGLSEFMRGMVTNGITPMVAQGILTSAVDTANANPNKTWGDWANELPKNVQQSVVSALILSGAHVAAVGAAKGASAINDRAGSPSRQFGRAMQQDVDSAQFTPAEGVAASQAGFTANPNLADAQPPAAPPPPPPGAGAPPAPTDTSMGAAQSDIASQLDAIRPLQDKAKALRDAGEDVVADEMDRRANTQAAGIELQAHPSESGDFQDFYRTLRQQGAKPAEASARAGMVSAFAQKARDSGISPAAIDAAMGKVSGLPLAKIPAFLDTFASALHSSGMGEPLPAKTIETAAHTAGEQAMGRAIDALYPQLRTPDASIPGRVAATAAPLENTASPRPGLQRFPAESGTLGIPRADMPQIRSEDHGALVNFLNARDVPHEIHLLPTDALKPSQAEFSPERVKEMAGVKSDRSVIASSDGYILDGHHQWMAAKESGEPVKTIVLQAPIRDLIEHAKEFPSANKESSQAAQAPAADEAAARGGEATGPDARADRAGVDGSENKDAVTDLSWAMRPSGTLSVKGDAARIKEVLKDIPARSLMVSDGGYMIGRTQVDKALAILEGRSEETKATKPLSVGTTPADTEIVTVKDGVVHIGKHEAINFDSGEPVKVKASASDEDIKQALKNSGALGKRQKFFYGEAKKQDLLGEAPNESQQQAAKLKGEQADKERQQQSNAPAPDDFKLTGSKRDADGNPDQTPMFSRDAKTEPFYSALSKEMDAIGAKAMPAAGWSDRVKGLVNAGKVKADEVEWSGLNDWLKLQQGKVTKEQVGEFLKNNGVQVQEVTKGAALTTKQVQQRYEEAMMRQGASAHDALRMWEEMRKFSEDDTHDEALKDRGFELVVRDGENTGNEIHDAGTPDGTKYGQYTLPGGANYREVLLTLPEKDRITTERVKVPQGWGDTAGGDIGVARHGDTGADFRSGHWEEPNVLAHIRLNDRTDADGKKVLFVEELQSDWAQAGRKEGFDNDAKFNELVRQRDAAPDDSPQQEELQRQIDEMGRNASKGVPRAPFVEKTDAWLSLALKRIVKMAADEGYDRVAFVNGEQSADRYDLSKQISKISYEKVNGEDKWEVFAYDHNGKVALHEDEIPASRIEELVGKDIAKKIVDDEGKPDPKNASSYRDWKDLSGLDLKVGGEGMKSFYDKIVPNAAKDVVRKLGGEGMREVTLPGEYKGRAFTSESEPDLKQPGFDITDKMREKVAGGVPLFRRGDGQASKESVERAQAVADRIAQKWTSTPKPAVVASYRDLPVKAPPDAKGLYYQGKSYVVADRMGGPGSVREVGRVIAHEVIAHHGLRDMLGREDWHKLMTNVSRAIEQGNVPLSKIRDEVRRNYVDENGKFNLSAAREADEITARAAEDAVDESGNFRPGFGFFKAVYAKIAQFLRDRGINIAFTHAELQGMLVLAQRHLEVGERTAGGGQVLVSASRGPRAAGEGGTNGEPMLARTGAGGAGHPPDREETAIPPKPPGLPKMHGLTEAIRGVMHDALLRIDPMAATDNRKAQATAQRLADSNRIAQDQWRRMNDYIVKEFTPEQRRSMWDAADAENEQRMRVGEDQKYERPEGVGLDSLQPRERALVERMHEYGQELWKAAKAEDMVEGDGLPFWTPRMLVTIGEDGNVGKLSSTASGPRMATAKTTRLTTTASSLKHRAHRTAEETEAAGSALAKEQGAQGAQLVRDIATMPLAMYRLERAIAGRRLVNELKAYGQATGEDIVRDGWAKGYETIAHPAFTTFRPRFEKDAEGKTVAMTDENGKVMMDRVPLYIRSDWIGPLRAVTDVIDNKVYSGFMLIKSKVMSGIVGISPLIHQMVIYGGAMGYAPAKVFSTYLYWRGHSLQKDSTFTRRMLKAGVVPVAQRSTVMDVTDIAKPLGKEGGWGDPNESWINLSARAAGNAMFKGAGDKLKAGMDKVGDVYHGTLLWNRIQDLQAGIFDDAARYFVGKGLSENAADIAAAHFANRYAGVIANENMGALAKIWANVVLFSRSFTLGNIGKVKDIVSGLPSGLKAKLYDEAPTEAKRADMMVRAKALKSVTMDIALGLIFTSLAQDLWDHFKKDKTWSDIEQGYVDRFGRYVEGIKQLPTERSSWSPWNLSATGDNEPGKKDRVDMGEGPTGRHEYVRLPTGKVPEDMVGWVLDTASTFRRKLNPMVSGPFEAITNDKGFGVPVHDPDGSLLKAIGESLLHIVERSGPSDVAKGIVDVARGTATDLDKEKLAGNMTGFTVSQGHPGGPEAAVAAKTNERFEATKKYTMQQVKDDLKRGDEDKAVDRMESINMSAGEIRAVLKRAEAPSSGLSKAARKRFEQRSNDAEKREMELQQGK